MKPNQNKKSNPLKKRWIALIIFLLMIFFGGSIYLYLQQTPHNQLIEGIKTGNLSRAESAIRRGANVAGMIDSLTILNYAVRQGKEDAVKFLLREGAHPNKQDKSGKSALFYTDRPNMAELLIHNGANIHARDKIGLTPIMVCDNTTIARVYFENGAGLNAQDYAGNTPLIHAIQKGLFEMVDWYLQKEVELYTENFLGKSAFDYAIVCKDPRIRRLFNEIAEADNQEKARRKAARLAYFEDSIRQDEAIRVRDSITIAQKQTGTYELIADGMGITVDARPGFFVRNTTDPDEHRIILTTKPIPLGTEYLIIAARSKSQGMDHIDQAIRTLIEAASDKVIDGSSIAIEQLLEGPVDDGGVTHSTKGFNIFITEEQEAKNWKNFRKEDPHSIVEFTHRKYILPSKIEQFNPNSTLALCIENRSSYNADLDIVVVAVVTGYTPEMATYDYVTPQNEPQTYIPLQGGIVPTPSQNREVARVWQNKEIPLGVYHDQTGKRIDPNGLDWGIQVYTGSTALECFSKAKYYKERIRLIGDFYVIRQKPYTYRIIQAAFPTKDEAEARAKQNRYLSARDYQQEKEHFGYSKPIKQLKFWTVVPHR